MHLLSVWTFPVNSTRWLISLKLDTSNYSTCLLGLGISVFTHMYPHTCMHTYTVLLSFNASLTYGVQSLLVKINYFRLLLESFLSRKPKTKTQNLIKLSIYFLKLVWDSKGCLQWSQWKVVWKNSSIYYRCFVMFVARVKPFVSLPMCLTRSLHVSFKGFVKKVEWAPAGNERNYDALEIKRSPIFTCAVLK